MIFIKIVFSPQSLEFVKRIKNSPCNGNRANIPELPRLFAYTDKDRTMNALDSRPDKAWKYSSG
jgi:hypothetical protein